MLFFVVFWSIWLKINLIVFENKPIEECKVNELIIFRLTQWVRAKWPDSGMLNADASSTYGWTLQQLPNQETHNDVWKKPRPNFMKFNVDGSTMVLDGDSGIGGILRDESGFTKAIFSMNVGRMSSDCAEYMAIYEAFCIFGGSIWCNAGVGLIVETDSLNACEWAKNTTKTHWRFADKARALENIKRKIPKWEIHKISRSVNGIADSLAKAGVRRSSKLISFL